MAQKEKFINGGVSDTNGSKIVGCVKNGISAEVANKIFGDMEKDETWDKLEEYLDRELYFASGSGLLIACTCHRHRRPLYDRMLQVAEKMEAKNKKITV